MLVVSVRERGKEEHPFTFDKDTVVIGRLRVNDVILPKRNISKKHATLEVADGVVRLTDLESTNGTYVNGKRIAEAVAVHPEDKIFVGDYIIQVRMEESRSAIDGKVEPLTHDISTPTPVPDLEIRSTMQDIDGAILEKELEKYGMSLDPNAGPVTQTIEPGEIPTEAPSPPELSMDDALPPLADGGDSGDLLAAAELDAMAQDIDRAHRTTTSPGVEELEEVFEIPLEEDIAPAPGVAPATSQTRRLERETPMHDVQLPGEPTPQARPGAGSASATRVSAHREAAEPGEGLGPLARVLADEAVSDALLTASGRLVARDATGKRLSTAEAFESPDAVAELADRFAGIEAEETGVCVRGLPDQGAWLSFVFPPLSSQGIVASVTRSQRAQVPVSRLVKDQFLSNSHAKEFVRALTQKGTVMITGPEIGPAIPLLTAALGQLPGRPRYVALGTGVPRLGGDFDRERIDLSLEVAVEEPAALMEAVDLLQPSWLVAAPCSGRSLLALLAVSVSAQVPLLAVARLRSPSRLLDLLSFAERRENGALGNQGVVRMLSLADPLIVALKGDDSSAVGGLYEVSVRKDSGEAEIRSRG